MSAQGLHIAGTIRRGTFSVSLEVNFPQGKLSVIWGKSASGKSSILRAISGLDRQKEFSIHANNQCWQSTNKNMPTWQRSCSFVQQQPYLFPHLTVQQNLDLVNHRHYRLENIVADWQLQGLLTKNPGQLSGGEKQRVAIAQALLRQTNVVLFDEPLVGLHSQSRDYLLKRIKALQQHHRLTLLYVTHDFRELLQLADFVLLLDVQSQHFVGSIQQLLNQQEIYQRLGLPIAVFLNITCVEYVPEYGLQHCLIGEQTLVVAGLNHDVKTTVPASALLYVSAVDVSVSLRLPQSSSILNVLLVEIKHVTPLQDYFVLLGLHVEGQVLLAVITRYSVERMQLTVGQMVYASIKASQLRLNV